MCAEWGKKTARKKDASYSQRIYRQPSGITQLIKLVTLK